MARDFALNRRWIESMLPKYPYKAHVVFSDVRPFDEREAGMFWAGIMVSEHLKLVAYKDNNQLQEVLSKTKTMRNQLLAGWPDEQVKSKIDYSAITAEIIGRKY